MLENILNGDLMTLALILVLTCLLVKYMKITNLTKCPPGPRGLPVIGCMMMIKNRPLQDVFRDLRGHYGDIFSVQLGSKLFVVINGYDNLRKSLVKQGDNFSDRPDIALFSEIRRKQGITASSGEHWKQTRTWMLSAMRNFGFGKKSLQSKIKEEMEIVLHSIANHNGRPFDIKYLIQTSISNIICNMVFGDRFEHNDKEFINLIKLIEENFRLNAITGPISYLPLVKYVPGDYFGLNKFYSNSQKLREYTKRHIENHRKTFISGSVRDIIDIFLEEQMKHSSDDNLFQDNNLLFSINNLFVAGIVTTATTILWAILALVRNRDVQLEMRQEIEKVVGTSRLPRLEDRLNMPICEAVISEALRFRSIFPVSVPHGATESFTFNGFTIPKGAVIIPYLDSVLHDSELFPQPEKFDPHRFLNEDGKLLGKEKVLSFSLGRRVCMGEALARMELFLFLTSIVQRFDLLPAKENELPSLDVVEGFLQAPLTFDLRAVSC